MRLSASQIIQRPADEVFGFVADVTNNPRWQRGMRSCAWTSPPPITVGSTYRQEASFLGRPLVTDFEVVDHEPGVDDGGHGQLVAGGVQWLQQLPQQLGGGRHRLLLQRPPS